MKPRARTYTHPYVARLGQHYIGITSPLLDGPHSALAYLKGDRIYTRDMCFERHTGSLLYGVLRVPTVLASETVLAPGDVRSLALWGARGWEPLKPATAERVPWRAPAYLPTLDR